MSNKTNVNSTIVEIVENTNEKYNLFELKDTIVVGVSGGPDSVTLLNVLYNLKEKYNLKLVVAHINHMIRKESDDEAIFVENICKEKNIPFEYKKIDVEKIASETKESTETVGRKIRYDFFSEVASKYNANKIAVAHNLDDSVETTFMNLIRGTGINGLIGIKYKNKNIIRPLLNVSRDKILKYCEENNLNPKFDKTNYEQIYTRNKIRLDLLPNIKENYNTNLNDTILRLKEILIEEKECIDEIVDEKLKDIIVEKRNNCIVIDRKKANLLNNAILKRIIIKVLEYINGSNQNIETTHINIILDLIKNKATGKQFIIGKKYKVENIANKKTKFIKL